MAKKSVKIWKEGNNIGAVFSDGNKRIQWQDLTEEEKCDLVQCMYQMAQFFNRFLEQPYEVGE